MRFSGSDFGDVFGFPHEVVGQQFSQILAVVQIIIVDVAQEVNEPFTEVNLKIPDFKLEAF